VTPGALLREVINEEAAGRWAEWLERHRACTGPGRMSRLPHRRLQKLFLRKVRECAQLGWGPPGSVRVLLPARITLRFSWSRRAREEKKSCLLGQSEISHCIRWEDAQVTGSKWMPRAGQHL
jgi:hypothetical protein